MTKQKQRGCNMNKEQQIDHRFGTHVYLLDKTVEMHRLTRSFLFPYYTMTLFIVLCLRRKMGPAQLYSLIGDIVFRSLTSSNYRNNSNTATEYVACPRA